MARYYFHTEDGTTFTDREGLELPGIRAARIEAARAIGQMVDARPDDFWQDGVFKMTVTDEGGLVLFILDLSAIESPAIAPRALGSAPEG